MHFNAEHHILLEDAKKIKKGVELNDEIIFPLEAKEDYGRIAAQTAKQVIIQKIREAIFADFCLNIENYFYLGIVTWKLPAAPAATWYWGK